MQKRRTKMDNKLLTLIENDASLTTEQLAVMLGKEKGDIAKLIKQYESEGVILGRKSLIDWDKTDREYVTAFIEVKSLYLMSGGFDFVVMIEGKTMKEVAYFVAQKLATIEFVTSTATHFVLKKYKDNGVIYKAPEKDERGVGGV